MINYVKFNFKVSKRMLSDPLLSLFRFLANLVAVFGEFDISGELESRRSVTKNIRRVIVHRQYDAATFANDLALLELESPVAFDEHIVPICMPRDKEDFTGRMATVTGWGRLKYGGHGSTQLSKLNRNFSLKNTKKINKTSLPQILVLHFHNIMSRRGMIQSPGAFSQTLLHCELSTHCNNFHEKAAMT
jgi:hypothetical protein